MKKMIMALCLILSFAGLANDWDLYRDIMNQDSEVKDPNLVEIPEWMLQADRQRGSEDMRRNRHSSFENYLRENGKEATDLLMGNDGPHGGDTYGGEFARIGFKLAQMLKESPEAVAQKIDLEKFHAAIESVIIYSEEGKNVVINGQNVDAINFPKDKKIILNRSRWREMLLKEKVRLVFHEYLGIIDAERDVYKVSIHFNRFFDEVVSDIKEDDSAHIRYYGVCVAPTALFDLSNPCSLEKKSVKEAIECSKEVALRKCQMESYHACEGVTLFKKIIAVGQGVLACELTSIVQ